MSDADRLATHATTDTSEDEGGGIGALRLAGSLGVIRHMNTYSVGDFHYRNVADAIAQARRMTKLEGELR